LKCDYWHPKKHIPCKYGDKCKLYSQKSEGICKYRHGDKTYYTMFHGTTFDAAQKIKNNGFIPSKSGMLGPGVYLSKQF